MSDKCPRCKATLNFTEAADEQSVKIECPACQWTPAIRKFVSIVEVTPELLRDADHSKLDIWREVAAPYDAVLSTVWISKLKVPSHHQRFPYSITVYVLGWAERKPEDLDDEFETVYAECPTCGAEQEDHDGFGVLYCPACGFCTHSSRSGDICGFCQKRVTSCKECGGRGSLQGHAGIDDGAECGACEGAGIIVEEVQSGGEASA